MALLNLSAFQFTPKSDTVDKLSVGDALFVNTLVDTLTGNDSIKGKADSDDDEFNNFRIGLFIINGTLRSGPDASTSLLSLLPCFDDDVVVGEGVTSAESSDSAFAVHGILLENGKLSTGIGNDFVKGTAKQQSGTAPNQVIGIVLFFDSTIELGSGSDTIIGEASSNSANVVAGIDAVLGNIKLDTGDGNDCVNGKAICNSESQVKLPSGITVEAGTFSINTGNGCDSVTAFAMLNNKRVNGFSAANPSSLIVTLGSGIDRLEGFGTMTADGGSGTDIWYLRGYSYKEFSIAKTDSAVKGATFSGPEWGTANVRNFETFIFDDGIFSYNGLPSI